MATIDMRPQETSEVNSDEEVKTDGEETVTEEITPSDGEGTEDASSASTKTQEDQKEDEEQVEGSSSEESSDATSKKETEIKKEDIDALRLEREKLLSDIKDLRSDRRELKNSKKEEPLFVPAPMEDELKDLNPDDITLVEKVLKAKGYVRREELQEQTYKTEVNKHTEAWLDDHPEYKPENDPKDEKWDVLSKTIKTYFKAPTSPKEIKKVLDLAHQMLNPDVKLPVRSRTETETAKQKISLSSKGSSGSSESSSGKTHIGNLKKDYLKGFSDEEMKELFS